MKNSWILIQDKKNPGSATLKLTLRNIFLSICPKYFDAKITDSRYISRVLDAEKELLIFFFVRSRGHISLTNSGSKAFQIRIRYRYRIKMPFLTKYIPVLIYLRCGRRMKLGPGVGSTDTKHRRSHKSTNRLCTTVT
jgi:hypothetical protein